MTRLALLAMSLVACGGGGGGGGGAGSGGGGGADESHLRAPAADSMAVTAPVSQAPDAGRQPTEPCPATGLWAACSVLERLDRAGLAPRRDTGSVAEPPLRATGLRLRVSAGQLELYVYRDAAARARDGRLLDRARYVAADAPVPIQVLPTLIINANLIAILHSRNDHLRERVADAIAAGPPQPSRP